MSTEELLKDLMRERILVLDGAMGTLIQRHELTEEQFRGERFADHPRDLKGANEALNLTQPDIIRGIHGAYLDAGADIITTNTFNGTAISLAEYGLEDQVEEINRAAAALARSAADAQTQRTPDKPRFVAGSLGPTTKTASISPDVNDPGARNVTWDELVAAYHDGGARPGRRRRGHPADRDDLRHAQRQGGDLRRRDALRGAGLAAAGDRQRHDHRPVRADAVGPDRGRVLEQPAPRAAAGDRAQLRARRARCCGRTSPELARIADVPVITYPNAGLPNAFGGYDEQPPETSAVLGQLAREGALNLVGGCCGTTPDHTRAIVAAVEGLPPRVIPTLEPATRLAGLEPLDIGPDSLFVNVGERTNVTGSRAFARLIKEDRFDEAVAIARQQVDSGAQMIDINMDEALLDSEAAMARFLNLIAAEPDIARVPVMIDSSKWAVIEEGLKHVQGRPVVNSLSLKEGEAGVPAPGAARAPLRRGRDRDGLRRAGPGRHGRAQGRDRPPRLRPADRAGRLRSDRRHPRPQHLRHRHGHRGARRLRRRLHRGDAADQGGAARTS